MKYQWLWYGYGIVYYQDWRSRRYIHQNEESPYFNKEKSEILKMLQKPDEDVIDTIYLNTTYHFASTQEWCKSSIFKDSSDTVAIVNNLYWDNLNERKTRLVIVLINQDGKWISRFVCHWDPDNICF